MGTTADGDLVTFTRFKDIKGRVLEEITQSWPEMVAWLEEFRQIPQAKKEECSLVKLARFGEHQTSVGCFRTDENVVEVFGIEMDYDGEEVTPDEAKRILEHHNVKAVVVTSWSHEPDAPRWRVLAPFRRARAPQERAGFAAYLHGIFEEKTAPESFRLSQSYFVGCRAGAEYRVLVPYDDPGEGFYLDELDPEALSEWASFPSGYGGKPYELGQAQAGRGLPDDITRILTFLDADCSHDEWIQWGMALHDADPSETGFRVWDEWSRSAPHRYPGEEPMRRRWASFGRRKGSRVTVGSLIRSAKLRGYQPPVEYSDLTDTGNAARLVQLHGHRLHYMAAWGEYLVWDEATGLWFVDHNDVRVRELAKDVGRALREAAAKEENPEDARRVFGFALRSMNASGISGMVNLARGVEGIPLHHEALDSDGWLLGVQNGVLDLRTGRLRASDPADLITLQCPVHWDGDARAPRFERCMREWFPRDEVRSYVKRVAGSALVGGQRDHVIVIFYGLGRNGKGTFVRAIFRALGPHAGVIHLSLLVEQKHRDHDTVKAALFRKRLAVASETQRRVKLDEASVKNLTGGDRITARRMRENPWEFDPTHSLWLQTNYLPEIGGRDGGIWSRIRVVRWESTFEEKDQDKVLGETLAPEAPGILRWLVEGCLEWQREGLHEPEEVVRETLAYRKTEDVFSRFQADTGLTFRPDLEMEAQELLELLRGWADEEGLRAPIQQIGKWLREHHAVKRQRRVDGKRRWFWVGLGIPDQGHESEQTDALA